MPKLWAGQTRNPALSGAGRRPKEKRAATGRAGSCLVALEDCQSVTAFQSPAGFLGSSVEAAGAAGAGAALPALVVWVS